MSTTDVLALVDNMIAHSRSIIENGLTPERGFSGSGAVEVSIIEADRACRWQDTAAVLQALRADWAVSTVRDAVSVYGLCKDGGANPPAVTGFLL